MESGMTRRGCRRDGKRREMEARQANADDLYRSEYGGGGTKNDKKRMKEGSENERGRGDVNHRRLHKREVVNYTLSGPLVSM